MDRARPDESPKVIWWRDVRRHWRVYVAGLCAMLITNGTEVLAPKTLQWIIDALMSARHDASSSFIATDPSASPGFRKVLEASGLFLIVATIGLMGRVFWRFTLARMTHVSGNRLKQGIWESIRGASLEHVSRYTLGDLMNRAIGDVNAARWIYGFTMVMTCDVIFFTTLGSVAMIAIHPGIAIACLSTFLIIPFIALRLARREYDAHERAQVELTTLSEYVSQSIRGIRAQRASNSFSVWISALTDSARRYSALRYTAQRISINSYPLCSLPTIVSYGILFAWGPTIVVRGELTVGEFAALASYVYLLQGPLAEIGDLVSEWQKGFASLRRISEIRDFPKLVDQYASPVESRVTGASALPNTEFPLLDVRNLKLARGGRTIFEDVTFHLKKGEWLGVSGPVGSGKSSLLQAIAGLAQTHEGSVRITGRSPATARSTCAPDGAGSALVYAPEKPFVFAGSLRDNLCLNQKYSDEQLWRALDAVCIADEVRRMPAGLETVTGEGGVSLSGGQRQRLALARIILRASNLVLLDDPLSAVDVDTESRIISNLRRTLGGMTVIVTSNKPTTLACCDFSARVADHSLVFESRKHPATVAVSGEGAHV